MRSSRMRAAEPYAPAAGCAGNRAIAASAVWRGTAAALALLGLLLPHAPLQAQLPDEVGSTSAAPLEQWRERLDRHLAAAGGEPAALSQQPSLRPANAARPARILFGAIGIDADAHARNGYDLNGVLLDVPPGAASGWLLFVVGTVERRGHRPAALIDVRVVARAAAGDTVQWLTGDADEAALARYASHAERDTALHFPRRLDRFRVYACAPALCVEEAASGAVWRIDLAAAASPAAGELQALGGDHR